MAFPKIMSSRSYAVNFSVISLSRSFQDRFTALIIGKSHQNFKRNIGYFTQLLFYFSVHNYCQLFCGIFLPCYPKKLLNIGKNSGFLHFFVHFFSRQGQYNNAIISSLVFYRIFMRRDCAVFRDGGEHHEETSAPLPAVPSVPSASGGTGCGLYPLG